MQPGWFETRDEKFCWENECTYFLCFMTIVINVWAIRHCHWRAYTAALKDLAISINVLCPLVVTSSYPLNNLAVMWYCVSFTYSWTVSQRCPMESRDNGTFRLLFPALCYCGSTEHVFALCSLFFFLFSLWAAFKIVFFFVFLKGGKTNQKVGYPVREAHFPCCELWRQSLKI